jgi:PPM family protein phosphatase
MPSLQFFGKTDIGKRRKDNQDTFLATQLWAETNALLVVIDGVGGYAGGERAAQIARESIERYMAMPTGEPLAMLREAVVFANNQIDETRQAIPGLSQMCCVLTAAVADVQTQKLYVAHVGDTRLYRFRRDELTKITQDHSLVGVREDAGDLTETEAMRHPRRNEILREVGSAHHAVDDPDFLETHDTDFAPGDGLLLCSDGLTDLLTRAQIIVVLQQPISLEAQAIELIRQANQAGGTDNITVVLARYNAPQATVTTAAPVNKTDRTRTDERPNLPVQSKKLTDAAATSPPAKSTAPTSARRGQWIWLVFGGLVAALIGSLVWYQFRATISNTVPISPTVPADSVSNPANTTAVSASLPQRLTVLDSLIRLAYRAPGHQLMLPADTFRLAGPIMLTDSLLAIVGRGLNPTVLMPADSTADSLAIRIGKTLANVSLKKLLIIGFKTGVVVSGDTKLRLDSVYFRNVGQPLGIRQETFLNTEIRLSTQAVLSRPKPRKP